MCQSINTQKRRERVPFWKSQKDQSNDEPAVNQFKSQTAPAGGRWRWINHRMVAGNGNEDDRDRKGEENRKDEGHGREENRKDETHDRSENGTDDKHDVKTEHRRENVR